MEWLLALGRGFPATARKVVLETPEIDVPALKPHPLGFQKESLLKAMLARQ